MLSLFELDNLTSDLGFNVMLVLDFIENYSPHLFVGISGFSWYCSIQLILKVLIPEVELHSTMTELLALLFHKGWSFALVTW